MPLPSPMKSLSVLFASTALIGLTVPAMAQDAKNLKLASDSPFHDPDIIYLEADELINDETNKVLTAIGEVEGRYEDKTLRADRVVYNLETGRVVATGNVVLIDASGSSQYADILELSNELEAGTASNFTSRFAGGGITGAKFATRRTDEGVDLYNAYYTACIPCNEKDKPTWKIKARQVSQDKDRNMVLYKDAVFQFLGIPILYTPYLAHPDPTAGRTSGWLSPYIGVSSSKGFNVGLPYYVVIDDYTELTLTPRAYTNVNPLMEYQFTRKFYSGEITIDGSFTYASIFDRDGNPFSATDIFSQPDHAPLGKRLRSHTFASGKFKISDDWDWGFDIQGASDDLYLDRYDLDRPRSLRLYDNGRLTSQIFAVGQDDDFRVSVSSYGYQSLRTQVREVAGDPNRFTISREDDSTLPIIAPKIEIDKFFKDPLLNGRLQTFADITSLTRKEGTNYARATAGLDWNKTEILPLGIEASAFAMGRHDYFNIRPEDSDGVDFNRTAGQVGADIRWPFIRPGEVDFILEPRAQITQSFGDGKISNFSVVNNQGATIDVRQDGIGQDLDQGLLWSSNKSYGYDFWQKGFRADVGGSATALWGNNRASLFVGRSFGSDIDDEFALTSGLDSDNSDYVGQLNFELGSKLRLNARTRYNDQIDKFTRIDTSATFNQGRFNGNVRYYKIDNSIRGLLDDPSSPSEEISGRIGLKITKNWSANYSISHDIDNSLTRRQQLGLSYFDDCTRIDVFYNKRNFNGDVIRDSEGIGFRISLLTLGETRTD